MSGCSQDVCSQFVSSFSKGHAQGRLARCQPEPCTQFVMVCHSQLTLTLTSDVCQECEKFTVLEPCAVRNFRNEAVLSLAHPKKLAVLASEAAHSARFEDVEVSCSPSLLASQDGAGEQTLQIFEATPLRRLLAIWSSALVCICQKCPTTWMCVEGYRPG